MFYLCMVELQSVTHMCGLGHNLGHHVYHRWGVWNGAFGVFRIIGSRKKYSDSQCCWKNILILPYNLKLNSGKIFCALNEKKTHSLRMVSGFFLLNNDDSFNALGLLKKYFWNYNLSFSYKIWTLIHNEIRHQSRKTDITDTVYCVFLHLSSALLQSVIYD
jgi:hypothetical protein